MTGRRLLPRSPSGEIKYTDIPARYKLATACTCEKATQCACVYRARRDLVNPFTGTFGNTQSALKFGVQNAGKQNARTPKSRTPENRTAERRKAEWPKGTRILHTILYPDADTYSVPNSESPHILPTTMTNLNNWYRSRV